MHRNAARAYAHACKYHWPFFHHPLMPLHHGWNKTHELGRDFDKICAPIPWEKKRGRKSLDLLLHWKIFMLWLEKRIVIPSQWFFVFTSWYGFQKKYIFATESEMEWYYYKDCAEKNITRFPIVQSLLKVSFQEISI